LLVSAQEHPSYEIVGWYWGWEAMQPRYWDAPRGGRGAYCVERGAPIMKPPPQLLDEVRKRLAPG
jgi:hypothetical protein